MKWILILILFSCGKHETPTTLDCSDNDGDAIANCNEERFGSDKFVADLTPQFQINGEMTFFLGNEIRRHNTVILSNQRDLSKEIFRLLTGNPKLISVSD